MINVRHRFTGTPCAKFPTFVSERIETPVLCIQQSEGGVVTVAKSMRCCAHHTCTKQPFFNFVSETRAAFCKHHAADTMVNVVIKRCRHDSCIKRPSHNDEGSKSAVFCKEHAQEGMVDVVNKHCAHDTCTKQPRFNVEGSKMPVFCQQHAKDCLLYTSPSPRDQRGSRMPSSA